MDANEILAIFFDVQFSSPERELIAIDTLSRSDVTLKIETSDGNAPFFRYAPEDEEDVALPSVLIVGSNIVTLSIGDRPVDFARTFFSFGDVTTDHGTTTLLVVVELQSATREFETIIPIAGDPLPPINTAEELEAFARAATFALATGALAAGRDIPVTSILDAPAVSGPTGGPDDLAGTAAADLINGLGGDDAIRGAGGDDTLRGGGGEDTLKGNGGDDVLIGGGGDDRLVGGGGADNLKGGGGDDSIRAGGGGDTVKGGGGADLINGGGGADVFQFRASDRNDVLLDFRQGQDQIQILSGAREFADLDIEQDGADVLIGFGAGQIRVVSDNVAAFGEDDFIF